jgi:hypothetical protein
MHSIKNTSPDEDAAETALQHRRRTAQFRIEQNERIESTQLWRPIGDVKQSVYSSRT